MLVLLQIAQYIYADVVKWYTRYLEVVVLARAWRFKSSHPHHIRLWYYIL